ncbi:MAG: caspase family protein [Myxococcota bacterium]
MSRVRAGLRNAWGALLLGLGGVGLGCAGWLGGADAQRGSIEVATTTPSVGRADDFLVVDCLLPGRVKKLGGQLTYMTPRRPVKTTARDCEIRGGEYVAYDRASYETSLRIWLPLASQGDARAQTYVGEIYEKGLGLDPDHEAAAQWYAKAAEQGYSPAQVSLGQLYEKGLGVEKDPALALLWYRRASGLDAAGLEFVTASASASGAGMAVAGPTIQIVEPDVPLTRGAPRIEWPADSDTLSVTGRAVAPAGLGSLTVNGEAVRVDARGIFRHVLALGAEAERVEFVAVDRLGQRRVRAFEIGSEADRRTRAALRDADFGRFHALVIGIDSYRELSSLEAAVRDARDVAEVLSSEYAYQVTLLENPTRYQILYHLNALREALDETDNLLVYYAGHGELDASGEGYWQPSDAIAGDRGSWIANRQIAELLEAMAARHVMVVADSCYSGSLPDASLAISPVQAGARARWEDEMRVRRSRTALTSGGLAPVLDNQGGPNSQFAAALIDVLFENHGILEGRSFYEEVSARVMARNDAVGGETPRYAPIKFAGHESGDFFLVPGG